MKKSILILASVFMISSAFAQEDSIKVERDTDTIRIGGMVILKKGGAEENKRVVVTIGNDAKRKKSKLSTSSFVFDIGFANWTDNTNYAAANANNTLLTAPGATDMGRSDFKLKTGKSVNVNIWLVMQKLSLINHYVNLKYGLGLELNNYRFSSDISFKEGGQHPYIAGQRLTDAFVFRDSVSFSKNKLAADYLTVPVMLNFNTNPNGKRGLDLSAGVSMGFLYSSRNKQISSDRGKVKNNGDFDMEKWKFSYIGEVGMGFVRLYGSYSPNSVFKNDLNFTPYTVGVRFGNW